MAQNTLEKISHEFATIIIEKMNNISVNYKIPWLPVNANFRPRNINGNYYNGINFFMLSVLCDLKKYAIPIFLTFNQAIKIKVKINKNSKSFPVYYYNWSIIDKTTNIKISFDEYNLLSDDIKKNYLVKSYLQYFSVFNISQTNYAEVYPDQWQALFHNNVDSSIQYNNEILDKMLLNNSWVCPIFTGFNQAYYSFDDKICIPEKKQFKEESFFYTILLHEMAHSTGGKDRLNRTDFYEKDVISYGREELVAELTAAFVASMMGINLYIRNENVSYLKNWIFKIKEEPNYLFQVLNDVNKNASFIFNYLSMNINEDAA